MPDIDMILEKGIIGGVLGILVALIYYAISKIKNVKSKTSSPGHKFNPTLLIALMALLAALAFIYAWYHHHRFVIMRCGDRSAYRLDRNTGELWHITRWHELRKVQIYKPVTPAKPDGTSEFNAWMEKRPVKTKKKPYLTLEELQREVDEYKEGK